MEYIHERTIETFAKRDLINDLEIIIKRNHIKLEQFLGLSVRGGIVNNDILNRVKVSSRTHLLGTAFFALNAIFQAKKFHKASWVFLPLPPRTYTEGNIFYNTIIDILELITIRSGVSSSLRPWVNENVLHFHAEDGIHLSDLGSTRKEYTFKTFIAKLFENCHTRETYDYISVSREFNQWLNNEDELEYIAERVKASTPVRRSPLKGRRFV